MARFSALSLCLLVGAANGFSDDAIVDYAHDIQPLLKSHCYKCHGAKTQESGFRLDVRSLALKGGESGQPAIVPNDCDKSELLNRINSDDLEQRMPPKGRGELLSADEISKIRSWIKQGAIWPDDLANEQKQVSQHWAFKPPIRPEVPNLKNSEWLSNPIDNFVLARLQAEGLQPSNKADKATLIRRLSLDLTGLPPSVEEVNAFLADEDADAYKRLVDRLLASPHYGERWGRWWLDAARYADSNGFEKDFVREVWFYRDWVIDALNRDMPYDQFVIQQIAGDQLPDASQQQKVATGFLRNSMLNEEGGADPEQFRMEAMFDRMDAIGKCVLGVTIQCAQCHNHKYDPLTQEEYYRMFAFLNNAYEANVSVYTTAEEKKRAEIQQKIAEIETALKKQTPDWQQQMAQWETTVQGNQPLWTVVPLKVDDDSTMGEKYLPQEDGSYLAQGYAPPHSKAKFTVDTDVHRITAFRLELLCDPNLPRGGPGRDPQGIAALSEFEVESADASTANKPTKIKFHTATSDFNASPYQLNSAFDDKKDDKHRTLGPVEFAIDDSPLTAWGTDAGSGRRNQPRKAVFVADKPINGTILTVYLVQEHGSDIDTGEQQHNLGRFRLSVTDAKDPVADVLPIDVREVLGIPVKDRSPQQNDTLFSYWRTTVPQWKEANSQIEELWKEYPEGHSQLVLIERDKPRQTYVLKRGSFLKPDREVSPGVPAFLHSLPEGAPATRLTFARWLVDRRSPTTARSLVNRVWQAYFGVGLVDSSENLGTQCELPSHPELLDWLAIEFMDRGWSLKELQRLIVNSSTYQQSSHVSADLLARDPYNRLLARGPRFRVEAETVRDIQLTASGLLSEKIGGPSVYPSMPEFLLKRPYVFEDRIWPVSTGEDRYRRALYTFRYRAAPYPMLQTFDAPTGESSCVRRPRSNTPLQALVTLNEPVSLECAQALARKTLEQPDLVNDQSRLIFAFQSCVARMPTKAETEELLDFCNEQKKRIAEGWLDPWQLIGSDGKTPTTPKGSTPTELAAWTCVSRVLLNLDETITKE